MNTNLDDRAKLLIEREILANQDYLVRYFLDHQTQEDAPISWDDIENLYDECDHPREIFEWYLVTRWLFEKLKAVGEPVLQAKAFNSYYWGRTCFGQAIYLDGTFQEILKRIDNEH